MHWWALTWFMSLIHTSWMPSSESPVWPCIWLHIQFLGFPSWQDQIKVGVDSWEHEGIRNQLWDPSCCGFFSLPAMWCPHSIYSVNSDAALQWEVKSSLREKSSVFKMAIPEGMWTVWLHKGWIILGVHSFFHWDILKSTCCEVIRYILRRLRP